MARYNPVLDALPTYPQQALNQRKAQVRAQGKTLYDFGVGDPIEPVPEFIRNALKEALPPHCGYPTVRGPQEFRESGLCQAQTWYRTGSQRSCGTRIGSGPCSAPMLFIDPKPKTDMCCFRTRIPHIIVEPSLRVESLSYPYLETMFFVRGHARRSTQEDPHYLAELPHNPSGVSMSHEDLQKTVEGAKVRHAIFR